MQMQAIIRVNHFQKSKKYPVRFYRLTDQSKTFLGYSKKKYNYGQEVSLEEFKKYGFTNEELARSYDVFTQRLIFFENINE